MSTPVKIGVAALVFVGVFALTWFIYYPHSPLGQQMAHLKLAEKHQPIVEASLSQIASTDRVRVGVYTGLGGSLSVSGDVLDERTAEKVIDAVLAGSPPVTVQFLRTVGETNIIRKVVEGGTGNSHRVGQ